MKVRFACFSLLAAALSGVSGLTVLGQDNEAKDQSNKAASVPTSQERLSDWVASGPGVHNVKKDKDGRILSCVVVGQSRISTVLGKANGLEVARDKAVLACSAEFARWLKEDVKFYQSSEEETILLLTGDEGGESDVLAESGKAVEKSSKKIESISQGLVRGLQLLHKEVDGSGKNYSVVKGWSAANANSTKAIAEESKDVTASPSSDKGNKAKGKDSNSSKKDKTIDDVVVTAEDADEFLSNPK